MKYIRSLIRLNPIRFIKLSSRGKIVFSIIVFAVFIFYFDVYRAPAAFPATEIITITEGATLSDIALQFEEQNLTRSAMWLKGFTLLFGRDENVFSGDYFFGKRRSVADIAWRITHGTFGLDSIRITIPEGVTVAEMAAIFERRFDKFESKTFIALARDEEGYLFPDTYLFLPNVKAVNIFQAMRRNFDTRIMEVQEEIDAFGKPLSEVIIMASLLEEEARALISRRTIAGILWKRISIDMPLQVDATFLYINGKNTFNLTLEDLKTDSPYNTYRYKGLPIGPITNPGLSSILAAVTPVMSDYLFYLSDYQSNLYYSRTFEEHRRKKALYLR